MRAIRLIALPLALLAVPARAGTALPAWLAGTWMREAGAAWSEQLWTVPRKGQMLGISRTGFGPDVTDWDYLRIELAGDGRPELVAQAKGKEAVRYALAVSSESAIEFANAGQAFPQRIRFGREGQLLIVERSRMDGSDAERWNFRPVAAPAD